jgi:Mrp family chromosome partitioning ATPase
VTILSGRTHVLKDSGGASRQADQFEQQMTALVGLLLRLIEDQGAAVLHVTAVAAGEGASTIARGLALAAAQSAGGSKVALLDACAAEDRSPDMPPDALDVFLTSRNLALRVQSVGGTELSVGTLDLCGAATLNIEHVKHARAFYGALRAAFTLTIIDCPPVSAPRPAIAYSKLADGVLLVIAAETTLIADIENAIARLDRFGATVLGVVMNRRLSRVPRFVARLL